MSKSCAIAQSNYIPWKGYFDQVNMVDEFIVYDCVQYTKNDWRNRNRIKTTNGVQWLTIPVSTPYGLKTRIDEAIASDPDWTRKHWNSLVCNYGRSKYFEEYETTLSSLYKNISTDNLSEINLTFSQYIRDLLSIRTKVTSATSYEWHEDRNMRLVNMCKQVGASTYLTGPRASAYLDLDLFSEHGIKVVWMDYSNYPEYVQPFPPFEHSVSILDLLFNEGPNCRKYMLSFDKIRL
jgi:hypothetical protein